MEEQSEADPGKPIVADWYSAAPAENGEEEDGGAEKVPFKSVVAEGVDVDIPDDDAAAENAGAASSGGGSKSGGSSEGDDKNSPALEPLPAMVIDYQRHFGGFVQPMPEKKPTGDAAGLIRPGSRVELRGLRARQDLNGACGTVAKFFGSAMRYAVKLIDGRGPFTVKRENIRLLASLAVPALEVFVARSEALLRWQTKQLHALPERRFVYGIHSYADDRFSASTFTHWFADLETANKHLERQDSEVQGQVHLPEAARFTREADGTACVCAALTPQALAELQLFLAVPFKDHGRAGRRDGRRPPVTCRFEEVVLYDLDEDIWGLAAEAAAEARAEARAKGAAETEAAGPETAIDGGVSCGSGDEKSGSDSDDDDDDDGTFASVTSLHAATFLKALQYVSLANFRVALGSRAVGGWGSSSTEGGDGGGEGRSGGETRQRRRRAENIDDPCQRLLAAERLNSAERARRCLTHVHLVRGRRDRENYSVEGCSPTEEREGTYEVVLGAFRTAREAHRAAVLEKCGGDTRAARRVMVVEGSAEEDGNTARATRFVVEGGVRGLIADSVDPVSKSTGGSARVVFDVYSGTRVAEPTKLDDWAASSKYFTKLRWVPSVTTDGAPIT